MQAYLNQANRLKAAGVPIHGVGVQAHLSGFISPELYLVNMYTGFYIVTDYVYSVPC